MTQEKFDCEYEMVRLMLRNNKAVVILRCPEHGTEIAVEGLEGAKNERGRLTDEFDYNEGREMAANGFDGLMRQKDAEHFDYTYAESVKDPALEERLKAAGYAFPDKVEGPMELVRQLGGPNTPGVREILEEEATAIRKVIAKVTAVLTADHIAGRLNMNINGKDMGDIPLAALLVAEKQIETAIGNMMINEIAATSLEMGGIDSDATVLKLKAAKMLRSLDGDLPAEQDWPREQN